MVAQSKTGRRLQAEITKDDEERLKVILYQAFDEWLRAYVVNLMKNIVAQKTDPHAVDRALDGLDYAIESWKKSHIAVDRLIEDYERS